MQKYLFIPMLAAVLAMVWGCSNDENMGGDLVPPSDKSTIHVIDTITIKACTMQEDTLYTGNGSYLIAGKLDDPIFGKAEASFATKFSNTSYQKFFENSVVDSMVLTLGLDTQHRRFYGDSLETVTINAYRLTDTLSLKGRYYQDFDISPMVDPKPVATATFVPKSANSKVKMYPSREYAEFVMKNCQDSTFDDNCGGLYFTIESSNCMVRFQSSSTSTEYTIYHHALGDTVVKNVSFSISSYDPSVTMCSHDYYKSEIKGQLDNPDASAGDYLYLQAICGTRVKIELPYVGKLKNLDNSKFSMITNARLLMPLADSASVLENLYRPIDYVAFSGFKENKEFYLSDMSSLQYDNSGNSYLQRMAYGLDRANRQYSVDFTGTLRSMIRNCADSIATDYSVLMSPNGRVIDFSRSVINSPTHPDRPMKLVVEYITMEK